MNFCVFIIIISTAYIFPFSYALPDDPFPAVFQLPLDFAHSSTSKGGGFTHVITFPSYTTAGPALISSYSFPVVDYNPSIQNQNPSVVPFPSLGNSFGSPTPPRPSGDLDLTFKQSNVFHDPRAQQQQPFPSSAPPPLSVDITHTSSIGRLPSLSHHLVHDYDDVFDSREYDDDDDYDDYDDDDRIDSKGLTHSSVFVKLGDSETAYDVRLPINGAFTGAKSSERDITGAKSPERDISFVKSDAFHPTLLPKDDSPSPASYRFKYDVRSPPPAYQGELPGPNFGRTETREGSKTKGRYYVDLPDGRRQIVEYYADETGYHPTITYVNL